MSEVAPQNAAPPPAEQAERHPHASPLNGVIPPPEARFPPGTSGNPAGRPRSGGLSVREWLNTLATATAGELGVILNDKEAPVAKKAAARTWYHAVSNQLNAAGSPIAGPELDRIMQHTELPVVQLDKNQRLDAGLVTERFDAVEFVVPGLPGPAPAPPANNET